tara:strand:- start:6 stop:323 length:318 start_codon:yes stop_codon:yes gene_type:complete
MTNKINIKDLKRGLELEGFSKESINKTMYIVEKTIDNYAINPNHYKIGGVEVFDFLKAKLTLEELNGFCKGNIIKYITRANHKNGIEDIKKAQWYLDKLITTSKK